VHNQIYLTADFLATKESEQSNNIRWFKDILKRPLQQATGLVSQEFKSAFLEKNGFVRSRFFEASGIHFSPSEMQFDYDANSVTDDSISYLQQHISASTLVVGYELSKATRTILDRAGITYIDIWLHPIRFLDDVLFAFNSNNPAINAALQTFNINEETYYLYADRLRVQNYRGFRRPKLDLVEDSALFVGQTLYDKAISSNGKMLSLLDFKEKFEKLCKQHSHVYYSRHPFVKEGDEHVIAYVKQHKNVSLIDDPAYFLLATDEIKTVASLSSSVVHEAKYFSKNTEFFFQPVITFGTEEKDYRSIYQVLLFGYFWSSILAPCFKVHQLEKVEFLDSKDKIRDMLSFYWGYRNIDKVESLKQTVGQLFEKKNNVAKVAARPINADWRAAIERANVVSFDVFDTLVARSCYFPTDVFTFIESSAREITNGKVRNFRTNRMTAEKKTRDAAVANDKHEVTTLEIYTELQRVYDLTDQERDDLLQLELSKEYAISVRRDAGWAMFKYAQKLGKEIIAISDMTHEHSFICSLLEKSGYDGFTKVYVSSQFGLRKHEGGLFEYVIEDLKVNPNDVLHIGDNIKGDLESSISKGLQGYHIPRASVNLEKAEGYTHFIDQLKSSKTEFDSHLFSIIARNYFDKSSNHIKPKTLFNGDPFNFGFCGLGPAIVGFASWIYNEAVSAGISDIFFLSRDGLIAKSVYDRLYGSIPGAPVSHYIYASRRAARVSTIYCLADIHEIAKKFIYSTTIQDYLWSRFGLPKGSVSDTHIQQFGFTGGSQPIGGKTSKDAILGLVESLQQQILDRATYERDAYHSYLENSGLLSAKSAALVDIGYAGSMQAAIQRITGKNLLGLYFATFTSARNEALDVNDMRGYVGNLVPSDGTALGIQTHRFIYESIFCAPHDSFVCIENTDGKLIPTFDEGDNDNLRRTLITQIHGGVEALASTIADETADTRLIKIEPQSSTRILDHWLVNPTIDDALVLEGLRFHDPVGPSSIRYIVPPREIRTADNIQAISIWKEGLKAVLRLKGAPNPAPANTTIKPAPSKAPAPAKVAPAKSAPAKPSSVTVAKLPASVQKIEPATQSVVANAPDYDLRLKRKNLVTLLIHPFEKRIILKTCNDKKIQKYIRDRRKFFADAKGPMTRIYGKCSSVFFS